MATKIVASPRSRVNRSARERTEQVLTNAIFLLPALIVFTLFVIYPVISSVPLSLTSWNGIAPQATFIGFANYIHLFSTDATFLPSLIVTVIYGASVMIIQNGVGLLLALSLSRFAGASAFLRVFFLIPMLLSSIAIGYIWSYLYQPLFGGINLLLKLVHLGQLQQDWLGNPHLALGSVIAANCWQWAGYSMIIFFAGLQLIPAELYEASDIDGASELQRFWNVTFPLLAPAFTINLILTLVGSLRVFDLIYVTTQGGPNNATESMMLNIYKASFQIGNYGYATALSLVFFVLIVAISVFSLILLRRREVQA